MPSVSAAPKSIGPRPLHLITPKTSDVGALIIRTGFGARYTVIVTRSPQNTIGTFFGPYINSKP